MAAAILLASGCGSARAADDLKTFLAAFSGALGRGAEAAVVDMAHFPLKNEVYQQPKTISKADFKAHFGAYMPKSFAVCLKAKAPQPSPKDSRYLGEWVVDCDGNEFYFAKFDGKWLYSGYENINE